MTTTTINIASVQSMIQTLDHVVVVHILVWDKRKSQINKYSDGCDQEPWFLSILQFKL